MLQEIGNEGKEGQNHSSLGKHSESTRIARQQLPTYLYVEKQFYFSDEVINSGCINLLFGEKCMQNKSYFESRDNCLKKQFSNFLKTWVFGILPGNQVSYNNNANNQNPLFQKKVHYFKAKYIISKVLQGNYLIFT